MPCNKNNLPKCPVCGKRLSDNRSSHCNKHMVRNMTNVGLKRGHQIWVGKKHSIETRKIMSVRAKENNVKTTGSAERRRKSLEYTIWRTSVFERDNYTCQKCGERGGVLQSHHKKQYQYHPDLRFDLNNGVTLCKKCHQKIYVRQKRSKGYDFSIHEDERRTIYDWYSAELGVMKSMKVVEVLDTLPIGDHYHKNKIEIFFLIQGEFLELHLGKKVWYSVPAPYKLTIPKGVYHKFICTPGTIIFGAATELFDPNDEIK